MSKYILFFTIIFNIFSETLILASFNTLHLGWDGKNYHDTAEILSLFDIIALQEVMKKEGLTNLVKELESVSDEKWSYHLSPYGPPEPLVTNIIQMPPKHICHTLIQLLINFS